jgi:hypothetical protein
LIDIQLTIMGKVCKFLCSVLLSLVTANVPSSLNLVVLMVETLCPSETSAITIVTLRSIPEDHILRWGQLFYN